MIDGIGLTAGCREPEGLVFAGSGAVFRANGAKNDVQCRKVRIFANQAVRLKRLFLSMGGYSCVSDI